MQKEYGGESDITILLILFLLTILIILLFLILVYSYSYSILFLFYSYSSYSSFILILIILILIIFIPIIVTTANSNTPVHRPQLRGKSMPFLRNRPRELAGSESCWSRQNLAVLQEVGMAPRCRPGAAPGSPRTAGCGRAGCGGSRGCGAGRSSPGRRQAVCGDVTPEFQTMINMIICIKFEWVLVFRENASDDECS